MESRAQLSHILLDVDFMHKPTVVTFRRRFGWIAIPWLIEIYCLMSRATNAIVTRDTMLGVADDMRLENGNCLIDFCVDHGLITQIENNGDPLFSNSRVIKDQESLAKRRKDYKERQAKHRQTTEKNTTDNAIVTRDNAVTDAFSVNTELLNTEYNINNNCKPPEDLSDNEKELWEMAVKAFPPETSSSPWLKSNAYITTGRKPLSKYPDVWLTQAELFNILKLYQGAKLPIELWEFAFNRAQTDATNQRGGGKRSERIGAASWLQGYIFAEAKNLRIQDLRDQKIRGA